MIISVLNLKGGTSKTTTAMALATAAVLDGKAVRVLDADPQSSATAWYYNAVEDGEVLVNVEPANAMYIKRLAGKRSDEWVFIDCPPNGQVLDEAMRAADFIVVPTTTNRADVDKSLDAVATLKENGKEYAVLVTRVEVNTLNYRGVMGELVEKSVSHFDTIIRKNVKIADAYKTGFGSELYGYAEVYGEIKEALEGE